MKQKQTEPEQQRVQRQTLDKVSPPEAGKQTISPRAQFDTHPNAHLWQAQRTIGNRYTQKLIKHSPPIQAQFKDDPQDAMSESEVNQFAPETIQKKENRTGLPDNLKSGIENLSGYSLDDVTVHYNSNKPSKLQAHAYAQGTDIHLASGQERHLPHEVWHVVQQKQGRVKRTTQVQGNVNINDDPGLENEASLMGAKAAQIPTAQSGFAFQLEETNRSSTHRDAHYTSQTKNSEIIQMYKIIIKGRDTIEDDGEIDAEGLASHLINIFDYDPDFKNYLLKQSVFKKMLKTVNGNQPFDSQVPKVEEMYESWQKKETQNTLKLEHDIFLPFLKEMYHQPDQETSHILVSFGQQLKTKERDFSGAALGIKPFQEIQEALETVEALSKIDLTLDAHTTSRKDDPSDWMMGELTPKKLATVLAEHINTNKIILNQLNFLSCSSEVFAHLVIKELEKLNVIPKYITAVNHKQELGLGPNPTTPQYFMIGDYKNVKENINIGSSIRFLKPFDSGSQTTIGNQIYIRNGRGFTLRQYVLNYIAVCLRRYNIIDKALLNYLLSYINQVLPLEPTPKQLKDVTWPE
ncbi:MAG: DUF4157 domain-containing protein [Anaerolineaceae bacterium]|nr:DUF4157 domain-containing protein [Anaerolineaceae bacterium]